MPLNSTNPGMLGGIGFDRKIQELTKRYEELRLRMLANSPRGKLQRGMAANPKMEEQQKAMRGLFGTAGEVVGGFTEPVGSILDLRDSLSSDETTANYGKAALLLGGITGGNLRRTSEAIKKGLTGLLPRNRRFKAFHGSPHDFDEFSMSKLGTGEGRQAYGHGLYFAQDEGIAKHYKKVLSGDSGKGSLYKVKIKGNKNAFLDHDKNFIHQTKKVQDSIYAAYVNAEKKLGIYPVEYHQKKPAFGRYSIPRFPGKPIRPLNDNPVNNKDTRLRMLREMSGEEIYSRLSSMLGGSAEAATKALKDAGIPGVKYFDGNKIRSLAQGKRGVGASNFVVFDDKTIKIIKKYGIAGLIASGAGAGLLDGGNKDRLKLKDQPKPKGSTKSKRKKK